MILPQVGQMEFGILALFDFVGELSPDAPIRKISAIFWEARLQLLISGTYVTFPIHICRQFTPEISALDAIVPKPGQNYVAFLHASAIPVLRKNSVLVDLVRLPTP